MLTKYRLMIPGPTTVPPEVAAAGALPLVDERIPRFAALFGRVLDRLRALVGTAGDVLLFASSTTGAMESTVVNLFSRGDRILVVNNGFFATRWAELARAYGLDVVEWPQEWGTAVDNDSVARLVAEDPAITAAVCVHCETSTGAVSDLAGFGAATRGVLSIVDAASSLGASEIRADEWGLDVVVSGSQKALMTPPGLSFVAFSDRAWAAHRGSTLPRFYFDWDAARNALAQRGATPWTPAVGLITQLDLALGQLIDEGMSEVAARHVVLGRAVRAAFTALGLGLLAPDDDANCVVTVGLMPPGIDADALAAILLDDHGVQITGGNGALAGRAIRVGHCGYVDHYDVVVAIAAIEHALRSLGHAVELGAGVAAAQEVFAAAAQEQAVSV